MSVNAFDIPMEEFTADAMQRITDQIRAATLGLFSEIVGRSPVDRGSFRANWNVSYGQADISTTNNTSSSRVTGELAKVLTLPVGGIVWMANGLVYGPVLEYGLYPNPPKSGTGKTIGGYSKQAPAGFVRLSIQNFGTILKDAAT